MKAKEYNKNFTELLKKETIDKAIYLTFNNMFIEVSKIKEIRKAKTDSALISIFKEMNEKGNSFSRLANKQHDAGLVNDAFKKFVIIRDKDFALLLGWF
tara:strand:+ start:982 stop:1278 length:297 start_codon:yes stop_codon:yes gene_type:complete